MKWISVEDRLPEDLSQLLVCIDNNDIYSCSIEFFAAASGITHWMPLPEPPNSIGEDKELFCVECNGTGEVLQDDDSDSTGTLVCCESCSGTGKHNSIR